ncbi:TonB-dependent siderophore receptor [Piscinibacter gummiphilus]|nr:TonB-dependent siderophore receptor [Piscinibacter gummiphilus]
MTTSTRTASTHGTPVPLKPVVHAMHVALLGLALGSAAHAQETQAPADTPAATPASGTTLPAVKVRARDEAETGTGPVRGYVAKRSTAGTRTDTPIVETPQSISVVTADRIEAMGATNVKDALSYTPGINSSPWGDDTQYDWIYIRGFDAYSPGFYLDGLALRNAGSWAVWQTENYGTERIEVLRGPSSVLYGQNGPGGVVNVVSKRPTATPQNEIQVQLGDPERRQVAGDFSGPLTESGEWLYRITGLVRDGETSRGLSDDRQFIAPSLTWRPSAATNVTFLSQYLRMRVGSDWSSYPAEGTLLPAPNGQIPISTFVGEPAFNRYDQDQWMVGYLAEHKIDDRWTVRQNLRYARFDTDYKTMYNGDFVSKTDPTDPAYYRTMSRTPFGSLEKSRSLVVTTEAEARLQTGPVSHTLLGGLDYQNTRFDIEANYGGTVAPIDLYAPVYGSPVTLAPAFLNQRTTLSQTGLYLQDQLKFDQRWVVTVGGRYDSASTETENHLGGTTNKDTDHKFTSRAGVVYLAPAGWAPYASYSESFAPNTTVDPSTGKPFKPQTGQQVEAGVRYQPPGRSESYSAAVFDILRRKYVTWDTTTPPPTPKQTGEVEVRGVELEASLQPIPRMNLLLAYTWIPKAEVTESPNASEIGKQDNAVPENQFSAWTDYRFDGGFKAGLGVRYVGSTYGSKSASLAKIPAYTLVDAMIGYDFGRWALALNARNLGDKVYVANCDGSGLSCSYGTERKVNGTVTYRW